MTLPPDQGDADGKHKKTMLPFLLLPPEEIKHVPEGNGSLIIVAEGVGHHAVHYRQQEEGESKRQGPRLIPILFCRHGHRRTLIWHGKGKGKGGRCDDYLTWNVTCGELS